MMQMQGCFASLSMTVVASFFTASCALGYGLAPASRAQSGIGDEPRSVRKFLYNVLAQRCNWFLLCSKPLFKNGEAEENLVIVLTA
jgi:hypothetical protein